MEVSLLIFLVFLVKYRHQNLLISDYNLSYNHHSLHLGSHPYHILYSFSVFLILIPFFKFSILQVSLFSIYKVMRVMTMIIKRDLRGIVLFVFG